MSSSSPGILLVATHPRSGTHLAINTLCLNFAGVTFQPLRGQYPTLERLIADHDAAYTDAWEAYLAPQPGRIAVVKTHMTADDVHAARSPNSHLSARDRDLLQRIHDTARRLYVVRDGRDALLSWFRYMTQFGGGLPGDLPARLTRCTLSEFIRMPNRYHAAIRATIEADRNRVSYWKHHVDQAASANTDVVLHFETLQGRFQDALDQVAKALDWSDRRLEPPAPARKVRAATTLMGWVWQALQRRLDAQRHAHRGVPHLPPSPAWAGRGTLGWREAYTPDDLALIEQWAGDTLKREGYATGVVA